MLFWNGFNNRKFHDLNYFAFCVVRRMCAFYDHSSMKKVEERKRELRDEKKWCAPVKKWKFCFRPFILPPCILYIFPGRSVSLSLSLNNLFPVILICIVSKFVRHRNIAALQWNEWSSSSWIRVRII